MNLIYNKFLFNLKNKTIFLYIFIYKYNINIVQ